MGDGGSMLEVEVGFLREVVRKQKNEIQNLEARAQVLKLKLEAVLKLQENYEQVKRILSISGDNPLDYTDEISRYYDDNGESGVAGVEFNKGV